jgi:hypothetical protein
MLRGYGVEDKCKVAPSKQEEKGQSAEDRQNF